MCEKKNKKLLVSLFLIPLFLFTSVLAGSLISKPAYAAVCSAGTSTFTVSEDGSTITQKTTGAEREDGVGTSYSSCQKLPDASVAFKQTSGNKLVYKSAESGNWNCSNTITLASAPSGIGTVKGSYQAHSDQSGCPKFGNAQTFTVATGGDNPTDSEDGADSKTSCAIQGVGWLLCPVINFGATVADGIYVFLSDSFLSIPTSLYDTNSGAYAAWQGILGFANIIFVIVFLIIIFSQATSIGLSNYGIKKMLPKLIIGVILINISYFICAALVDLSNIGGYGIAKFFQNLADGTAPTYDPNDLSNGSDATSWTSIAGAIIAGGVGVGIAAGLGFGALMTVLAVALVASLLIFIILILRQALIVICIILAPVAFAAWLLPNTEKLYKQWWGIFSKMLLLFPIIGLVFGASKLISSVVRTAYTDNLASGNTSGVSETVGQVIGAGILVIPLFAVPLLLKGALSTVPVLGAMMSKQYGNLTGKTRSTANNSRLAQYEKRRVANRNAQIAAGTYTGRTPYRALSGVNKRLNKNRAFNAITKGYGADMAIQAQGENRKQQEESLKIFSEDDKLMSTWAQTGGQLSADQLQKASNGGYTFTDKAGRTREIKLDEAQVQQYKNLQQAKLHRSSASQFAVADFLAKEGKGSFEDIQAALTSAADAGATPVQMAQMTAQVRARIRSSGDGYRLGQWDAHMAANGGNISGNVASDPSTIDPKSISTSNPAGDSYAKGGWGAVPPDKFSRFAFKSDKTDPTEKATEEAAKRDSFRMWLTDREDGSESTRKMLDKYGDMDVRAQVVVKRELLDAAEHWRTVRLSQAQTIAAGGGPSVPDDLRRPVADDIDHAKKVFGIR